MDKQGWIRLADNYDRIRDAAFFYDETKTRCVKYETATGKCGLFNYNYRSGQWDLDKELPVTCHDPHQVKILARMELEK